MYERGVSFYEDGLYHAVYGTRNAWPGRTNNFPQQMFKTVR